MARHWTPIEDLPSDWLLLSDGELGPLLPLWEFEREDLQRSGALATFNGQLARQWSIETGQIEGIYDIDRGTTQTLIDRGINADLIPRTPGQKDPEWIAATIRDHLEVLEGLFQFVKGERILSRSYINEIHAAFLRNQDTATAVDQFGRVFEVELLKGRYKQRPNNPIRADGLVHEYCPSEHVDSEMDRLIQMNAEHEAKGVAVEIEAAWLHHRFTQIHPYQDGNGRVARALASLLFLKAGWFPIVVTREDRANYIEALEFADEGHLPLLINIFADVQKSTLLKAMRIAAGVQITATVDDAVAAVKRIFLPPGKGVNQAVLSKSRETADELIKVAASRLRQIALQLTQEISNTQTASKFEASEDSPGLEIPRGLLSYSHNIREFNRAARLDLTLQIHSQIAVQAHGIGAHFGGLIGIHVLYFHRVPRLASENPFFVTYTESNENAKARFHPWLEKSLIRALNLWREDL